MGWWKCGCYSNSAIDKLIAEALRTADDGARQKILIHAAKLAFDDVAIIPLHVQKNIWATSAKLTYVPSIDETPRMFDVKPAQ
jgi:peptide/nickel transport system substrate-binding protein